jgi:hypothetical protein
MYDDDEYLQNILSKESKPNTNNNTNLKSIHVIFVMTCHENLTICDKRNIKNVLNIIYDDMAC